MALPFLVPMLLGAVAGAATNKEDRLRGALLGGTLGALTGGLGAGAGTAAQTGGQVATTEAAKNVALQEASKQATTEAAKNVAAEQAAKNVAAEQATKQAATETANQVAGDQLLQNAATRDAANFVGRSGGQVSLNPQAAMDLTAQGQMTPTVQGIQGGTANPATTTRPEIYNIMDNATEVKPGLLDSFRSNDLGVSQNPGVVTNSQIPQSQIRQSLQSAPANSGVSGYFGKAGQAVRSKPLQAMQFAAALSPQQQQQQQPVVVAQPYQQQQIAPPPSVEEKIAASGGSGPTFIPRGLFDEARNEFDEEERYNSRARSKALFS